MFDKAALGAHGLRNLVGLGKMASPAVWLSGVFAACSCPLSILLSTFGHVAGDAYDRGIEKSPIATAMSALVR